MKRLFLLAAMAAAACTGADDDLTASRECEPLTCDNDPNCLPNIADIPCDGNWTLTKCSGVTVAHVKQELDVKNPYNQREYFFDAATGDFRKVLLISNRDCTDDGHFIFVDPQGCDHQSQPPPSCSK